VRYQTRRNEGKQAEARPPQGTLITYDQKEKILLGALGTKFKSQKGKVKRIVSRLREVSEEKKKSKRKGERHAKVTLQISLLLIGGENIEKKRKRRWRLGETKGLGVEKTLMGESTNGRKKGVEKGGQRG